MEFRQVTFRVTYPRESELRAGLAGYDGEGKLSYIICAWCGDVFEPDEVKVVKEYTYWIDFTDTIIGDE